MTIGQDAKLELRAAFSVPPLPSGEVGLHRRCDPGEGLRPHDRPEPLTPALSPWERERTPDDAASKYLRRSDLTSLANASRQSQHEDQHFRHRLVQFRRNFIAEFDIRECAGQPFVLFDRDVMCHGDLYDLR